MIKVWVMEGDNDMDYSDHHNWFIGVADSLESAEKFIHENKETAMYYGNRVPETAHPIPQQKDSTTYYVWNWSQSEDHWNKVIIYIYEAEVYDGKPHE